MLLEISVAFKGQRTECDGLVLYLFVVCLGVVFSSFFFFFFSFFFFFVFLAPYDSAVPHFVFLLSVVSDCLPKSIRKLSECVLLVS